MSNIIEKKDITTAKKSKYTLYIISLFLSICMSTINLCNYANRIFAYATIAFASILHTTQKRKRVGFSFFIRKKGGILGSFIILPKQQPKFDFACRRLSIHIAIIVFPIKILLSLVRPSLHFFVDILLSIVPKSLTPPLCHLRFLKSFSNKP